MTTTERFFAYWQDSLNFLLGVVLFFSPWLFGFGAEQAAALNAHVVGAIIAATALLALFAFKTWEEWVSGVLGAWLVISPWILGFSAAHAYAPSCADWHRGDSARDLVNKRAWCRSSGGLKFPGRSDVRR